MQSISSSCTTSLVPESRFRCVFYMNFISQCMERFPGGSTSVASVLGPMLEYPVSRDSSPSEYLNRAESYRGDQSLSLPHLYP